MFVCYFFLPDFTETFLVIFNIVHVQAFIYLVIL